MADVDITDAKIGKIIQGCGAPEVLRRKEERTGHREDRREW
jgi:hypothetical protein